MPQAIINNTHLTFSEDTRVITQNMVRPYQNTVTHVTFPDGLIAINYRAFSSCTKLISVTFPDRLTTIGNFAFSNFIKLTQLDLPASITTIKAGAFQGCTGLAFINFPEELTTLGNNAFESCANLRIAIIPESLSNMPSPRLQATSIDLNTTIMVTSNKLDAFRRKNHLEKNTSMNEISILYQAQQKLIPLPNTLTNLKQHTVTQLSLKSLTSLPIEFHIIIPAIRLFSQIPTTTYLLQMALYPLGDKAMQAVHPLAEWITWIDAAKIWLAKSTGTACHTTFNPITPPEEISKQKPFTGSQKTPISHYTRIMQLLRKLCHGKNRHHKSLLIDTTSTRYSAMSATAFSRPPPLKSYLDTPHKDHYSISTVRDIRHKAGPSYHR